MSYSPRLAVCLPDQARDAGLTVDPIRNAQRSVLAVFLKAKIIVNPWQARSRQAHSLSASFFSIAFIFKIVVIVLLRISGRLHQDIFSFGRASICVDFTACFISMC